MRRARHPEKIRHSEDNSLAVLFSMASVPNTADPCYTIASWNGWNVDWYA